METVIRIEASINIRQTIEKVFSYVTNVENMGAWATYGGASFSGSPKFSFSSDGSLNVGTKILIVTEAEPEDYEWEDIEWEVSAYEENKKWAVKQYKPGSQTDVFSETVYSFVSEGEDTRLTITLDFRYRTHLLSDITLEPIKAKEKERLSTQCTKIKLMTHNDQPAETKSRRSFWQRLFDVIKSESDQSNQKSNTIVPQSRDDELTYLKSIISETTNKDAIAKKLVEYGFVYQGQNPIVGAEYEGRYGNLVFSVIASKHPDNIYNMSYGREDGVDKLIVEGNVI